MSGLFRKNKPTPKPIWDQFKGKPNSPDILVEKAKALSPVIMYFVSDDHVRLEKQLRESINYDFDANSNLIYLELVVFYLHFCDRIAFQHQSVEKRDLFVDALYMEVRESLSRVYESGSDATEFRAGFDAMYNLRQEEYGQHLKLYAEKDEPLRGTLFWEFGKHLAKIVGHDSDALVVMTVAMYSSGSLMILPVPELLMEL